MQKLKRKITKALAIYGGRITRFFNNLESFDGRIPEGSEIAYASYGGQRLVVTYADKE